MKQANVRIKRTLRDGSVTYSAATPEWLALLEVGCISSDEPNTASAVIVRDAPAQPAQFAYRQDGLGMALAMAGQLPGGLILH